MPETHFHHIHGDNIVECVRAFDYIVDSLGLLVDHISGPSISVTCPVYVIHLKQPSSVTLTFQFLPGYGEHRWNQDVLGFVKRSGGRLREAADAIITRFQGDAEIAIAAIEFCGALPAGNQAWQRQGRAFSFAHARVPFFYIAELGGFELAANRTRKAERMPNPAIPFSFYAMTQYQNSVCLPVYEANSGAKLETIEHYRPIYGKAEFLEFLKLAILGGPTKQVSRGLSDKCFALVELLADAKKRQDGLPSDRWRAARSALASGQSLPEYLSETARISWRKVAYIDSLTRSARAFMELGARESFGLTSSTLPLSFVPKDRRLAFANESNAIYPDMSSVFKEWLGSDKTHLAIAWVMGFKPRGDDARPDRGLPPLARMLVGDDTELLTFIYGPAPKSHWRTLATDPAKLAANNGLWEAVLAVSDGLLADSSTKSVETPRAYRKNDWASILGKEDIPLSVKPRVLSLGEQDVDTALHVAFESLGADIAFEGMCNPPGGDWSGISFRWASDMPEHRWLTLPRVSAEGAKRPDHVFALFGYEKEPLCLCIESKDKAQSLDTNIGPRLKRYTEILFGSSPSIHRTGKLEAWAQYGMKWSLPAVSYVSAGAYLVTASNDPFRGLPSDTALDIQIGVYFTDDGQRCELYLRGETTAGKAVTRYMQGLGLWGQFVTVHL